MKKLSSIFLLLSIFILFSCDTDKQEPASKNPDTNSETTADDTSNNTNDGTETSSFPDDFNAPVDSAGLGQGQTIQGWGGTGDISKTPILFIHGNGQDADAFKGLALLFKNQAGYTDAELWAFSYQGYPNKSSTEPFGTGENVLNGLTSPHTYTVDDIKAMVDAICSYTGSAKITIIAHSLGVTLTRYYLKKYNAFNKIETFVSIAGANHGMQGVETIEPEWTPDSITALCLHQSTDETPYGAGADKSTHLAPTTDSTITWITVHGGADDYFINYNPATMKLVDNTVSPLLDGADATISLEGKYSSPHKQYGIHFLYLSEPEIVFNSIKTYF